MLRVAVVDDDPPINDLFARWIREARPDALIDQLYDRDSAESAFAANRYNLICLDIELRPDKNAGIGLIKNILATRQGPVLVISSLNSEIYRPIMKELDAWDYLVKPLGEEQKDYFTSFVSRALREQQMTRSTAPAGAVSDLEIDPLNQTRAKWKGKKLNLPLTGQRIVRLLANEKGKVVAPRQLFELIPTGHNLTNLRAHIQVIRDAFKEVDPQFDKIHSVPAEGYFWKED